MTTQTGPKFWTHPFQKTFLLLCVGIHMIGGIASQVIESLDILSNSLTSLLQGHKLAKLNLHDILEDMVRSKGCTELSPWNLTSSRLHCQIDCPPRSSGTS